MTKQAPVKRYQDLFVKNGKFIGKFEEMYQNFDDPWHQTTSPIHKDSYSRNFSIINIRKYKIKSLIEVGCGLGYYTDLIHKITGIKILGIDISPTAVKKAKEKWPNLTFKVDDVKNIKDYSEYEAILFSDVTWCILNDLESVFKQMLTHFKGKYFLNNMAFYKGQQKYGTEFFTNLQKFINFVPFKLIAYAEAHFANGESYETSTIFKIEEK